MSEKKNKTPGYTRKAIEKYNSKFDRVNINLPKGTKERVKAVTTESLTNIVCRLLDAELQRLENEKC